MTPAPQPDVDFANFGKFEVQKDTTRTGRPQLHAGGYSYVGGEASGREADAFKWYCSVPHATKKDPLRKCKGRGLEVRSLLRGEVHSEFWLTARHTHPAEPEKLGVVKVKRAVKELSRNHIKLTPVAVVEAATRGASRALLQALPMETSLTRRARESRSCTNVVTIDFPAVTFTIPDELTTTKDGRPFLLFDSRRLPGADPNEAVIVWSSPTQLAVLHRAKHIAFDATFSRAPKKFYQLFSVLALIDGKQVPVCWAWMRGKKTDSYKLVWESLYPPSYFEHQEIPLKYYIADFERAARSALASHISAGTEGTVLVGTSCFFHCRQSFRKKSLKLGLSRFFREPAIKLLIDMVPYLALFPEADMIPAYWALVAFFNQTIDEEGVDLEGTLQLRAYLEYTKEYYLYRGQDADPREAMFPPRSWTIFEQVIQGLPTTNAAAEGANCRWNAEFAGQQKPHRSRVVERMSAAEQHLCQSLQRHEAHPDEQWIARTNRQRAHNKVVRDACREWARLRNAHVREMVECPAEAYLSHLEHMVRAYKNLRQRGEPVLDPIPDTLPRNPAPYSFPAMRELRVPSSDDESGGGERRDQDDDEDQDDEDEVFG